jgi:GNAT superfamily N-acetyltransferase
MLSFRPGRCDESPGRELLAELIDHFNAVYPGRAARPGSVTTAAELAPPHGAFLLGYEDGRPIACGGLRRLEDDVCEIKRIFVTADARSRGVGRALLGALESAARTAGYARARLDAGPEQRHSRALFAAAGYVEIEPYNANHIADYWAEKTLVRPRADRHGDRSPQTPRVGSSSSYPCVVDLASVTSETFAPHIGTAFAVTADVQDGPAEPLAFTLVDVTAAGQGRPDGRAPFAVTFRGPATPLLSQQIVPLDHPELGGLALFLVPIGVDADGARYEAVFN